MYSILCFSDTYSFFIFKWLDIKHGLSNVWTCGFKNLNIFFWRSCVHFSFFRIKQTRCQFGFLWYKRKILGMIDVHQYQINIKLYAQRKFAHTNYINTFEPDSCFILFCSGFSFLMDRFRFSGFSSFDILFYFPCKKTVLIFIFFSTCAFSSTQGISSPIGIEKHAKPTFFRKWKKNRYGVIWPMPV